jgi:hypothetical protein
MWPINAITNWFSNKSNGRSFGVIVVLLVTGLVALAIITGMYQYAMFAMLTMFSSLAIGIICFGE